MEWLSGWADVHTTNFVLPPTRRAAGVLMVHDLGFVRHPDTVWAASLRYQELVPRSPPRRGGPDPTATTAAEVADHYGLDPRQVLATPLGVDPAWAAAHGAGAGLAGSARSARAVPTLRRQP